MFQPVEGVSAESEGFLLESSRPKAVEGTGEMEGQNTRTCPPRRALLQGVLAPAQRGASSSTGGTYGTALNFLRRR